MSLRAGGSDLRQVSCGKVDDFPTLTNQTRCDWKSFARVRRFRWVGTLSSMASTQAKNYINGEWTATSQEFESLNPANTKETIGTAPLSTSREVDAAVESAKTAYESWRELSWVKRAEYIDAFAQLVKRDIEEISQLVTRECGKPINEGRADAVEALHMAQYIAGKGREPIGLRISSEISAKDAYILKKPKGVIACITPWNFPSAIPLWVILPSVVAGNTVVFKPASRPQSWLTSSWSSSTKLDFPKASSTLFMGRVKMPAIP